MVYACGVQACKRNTHSSSDISLFRIPAVDSRVNAKYEKLLRRRRLAWTRALKVELWNDDAVNNLRVCERHFASGAPAHFLDTGNKDWVPHKHMTSRHTSARCSSPRSPIRWSPKKRRQLFRNEGTEETDTVHSPAQCWTVHQMNDSLPNEEHKTTETYECSTGCAEGESDQMPAVFTSGTLIQTDLALSDLDAMAEELKRLNEEILRKDEELCRRNEEIVDLKREIEYLSWTELSFKDKKAKVKFYTALPNLDVLLLILSTISPFLQEIDVKGMSNFQKLLLTLMRLRQNASYTELAYRFRILPKQASRTFKKVIVILYDIFKSMVHWPDRDCLRANVPQCFRERFGEKVAIIIDCFEIFTEAPATLKAKAQIYSAYKGHHTIKYLIGITPHGFVSYISDGWGGRSSDKEITEQSGVLDNLLPGDAVLADRGFTVSEVVGVRQGTLNIPAFTKNRSQLKPIEVEKTRVIASCRIHVERVIGLLRNKFHILKFTLPITLLKVRHEEMCFMDVVVHVCCCLANMCDSIIPLESKPSKKDLQYVQTQRK